MLLDRAILLNEIKAYAKENYSKGWDVILETVSDDDILREIGNATTLRGAKWKLRKIVAAQREKAESQGFSEAASELSAGYADMLNDMIERSLEEAHDNENELNESRLGS